MWSIPEQKRRIHRGFGAFAHFSTVFIFLAEMEDFLQGNRSYLNHISKES